MRRRLIFPLLLATGVEAASGFALLAQGTAGATGGAATTSAIDTTGADLIVIALATNGTPTISDSAGNTWTALTASTAGGITNRLYHCINPTTSATHTFTASASGFPSIAVLAFTGSGTITFDGEAGGTGTSTNPSPGSGVTPAQNNALVVAGFGAFAGDATSINGGFTLGPHTSFLGGNHFAVGLAYLIQSTAAPADPEFTISSSAAWASRCAAFKP